MAALDHAWCRYGTRVVSVGRPSGVLEGEGRGGPSRAASDPTKFYVLASGSSYARSVNGRLPAGEQITEALAAYPPRTEFSACLPSGILRA